MSLCERKRRPCFQPGAQLAVVVNLAVEDNHQPAILELIARARRRQIDDGESPMRQTHAPIVENQTLAPSGPRAVI